MKMIFKYIWTVCLTFILLIIVKIIFNLLTEEKIQFVFLDFVGFFVGAIVINFFLKRDSIQKTLR